MKPTKAWALVYQDGALDVFTHTTKKRLERKMSPYDVVTRIIRVEIREVEKPKKGKRCR